MNEEPLGQHDDPVVEVEAPSRRRRPRRCIATRTAQDRRGLVRFVIGPDDRLIPDVDGRLPGRGLWLSADAERLKSAIARSLFQKAARRRVVVDPDLPARLEALLASRCRQWLGLARRGGEVIMGFEQVAAAVRAGDVEILVVASDAGRDGRAKLVGGGAESYRLVGMLDRWEIGRAVGRESLVYAALRRGRLAQRFWNDAVRLAGLRGDEASVRPASKEMIETA